MKRFKHYESYMDGSMTLISQGIKDDLGRTIHEETIGKNSGKVLKIRDTVYTDETDSCIINVYNPDDISVDSHNLKSVITEKYEKFP